MNKRRHFYAFRKFLKRRRDVVPMEEDKKAEIVRKRRKGVAELAIVTLLCGDLSL